MITYHAADCICFWRSRDLFGAFSNMKTGFALTLGSYRARTTEHLYQAMRFPDHPDVQLAVLAEPTALTAKAKAYQSLDWTRPDWNEVKLDVMEWCLELKLAQHMDRFGSLLDASEDHTLVEASPFDDFWGAPYIDEKTLRGWNHLGRLLMIMRDRRRHGLPPDTRRAAISIAQFWLCGEDAMVLAAS